MHRNIFFSLLVVLTCVSSLCAQDAFGPRATWNWPTAAAVRPEVVKWLDAQSPDPDLRKKVEALWPAEGDTVTGQELLSRLADTFSQVDADVHKLVQLCSQPKQKLSLPDFTWLLDEKTRPLVRNNMRLYYARWLAQEGLYDETLLMVLGLDVQDVVDPASLLFYQCIAHHRLLNMEESRKAAQTLLEREEELPRRYQQLARLMTEDLKGLKPDSLDHISRRMDDIRRRLDLGRAGKKVRDIEDGVIASLDKLIKELEEQQQQQQSSSSSGSQGSQSSRPMQDSRIASQKGPGKVDSKNIGSRAGWGDLPPKQREEALQEIGKEFPSHFRDAIEQYFRKIAAESSGQER